MHVTADKPERLAASRAAGLLDHPDSGPFDRLSRLAVRLLGARGACAALLAEEGVSILGSAGQADPFHRSPASAAVVGRIVETDAPVVIEDVRRHELGGRERVPEEPTAVAYLGVPLRDPGGHVLGAICAVELRARAWTEDDSSVLADLAGIARSEIALRVASREAGAGRARMSAVVESALDAIVVMDAGGIVVEFNPAAEALFGHPREEAVGARCPYSSLPPTATPTPQASPASWRRARAGCSTSA